MRYATERCAKLIRDYTPLCPEQTRAINAVEEALFLAEAAILRHTSEPAETCAPPAEGADSNDTQPELAGASA